ncbi:MAG: DNA-processing protein DprA [Candidatus Kerfeldbacteria bacterium]|nr:DNA-processing protein DprA [Candidatus Kerfeldbacteria bacterium]
MSEIFCIKKTDDNYPHLLRESIAPPQTLYCRGDKKLLQAQKLCAIVGSRTPTPYGLSATDSVVEACVARDVVTVSGLAFGIDARVHTHTLESRGKTIAVLGSSVDDASVYPRAHVRLAQRIIQQHGLLISEYPEGTKPHKGAFPLRNRIIAGLTQATCVVEAKEKSGSLITAYSALDNNREVYAVPGSIFSPQSQGTLGLIQRGAIPWINHNSFEELFARISYTDTISHLAPEEKKIVELCSQAQSLDMLLIHCTLPLSTLHEHVGRLLLNGYITLTPSGEFLAVRRV